jgi:hypothetical protein
MEFRHDRRRSPATRSFQEVGMGSAVSHVARVRTLFPEWAKDVPLLALRNEKFRSLCEEYWLATEALDLLVVMNRPRDFENIREYRGLIKDLQKLLKSELLALHASDVAQES